MNGNLLLDMIVGSHLHIIPPLPYEKGLKQSMQRLADSLEHEKGLKPYLIPVGGSNTVGLWGYLMGIRGVDTTRSSYHRHCYELWIGWHRLRFGPSQLFNENQSENSRHKCLR